jgi:hypothetical protein
MILLLILIILNKLVNIVKKMQFKSKYNKIIINREKNKLIYKHLSLSIKVFKYRKLKLKDQSQEIEGLVYHQKRIIQEIQDLEKVSVVQ